MVEISTIKKIRFVKLFLKFTKKILQVQENQYFIVSIFFIILIFGAYLRIVNIFNITTWFGDSGRDILVAKHMAVYKEGFFISPDSNGGYGLLNNSPFYFWLLTFSYFIFGSEYGVILLFCSVGIINILISFLLFKEFCKEIPSLFFTYFVSISSVLISFSKNVWQPHLLPFFQLLSLFFYIKGLKNNKYFFMSIQFSFLALHIHSSYLPLLLITILLVIKNLLKMSATTLIYMTVIIVINTLLWLRLSHSLIFSDISGNHSIITLPSSLEQFYFLVQKTILNIQTLGINTFGKNNFALVLPMIVFSLIAIAIKSRNLKHEIAIMLLTMISPFFLLGFYSKPAYFHYLYPYFLLFWIAIAFILANIRKYKYLITIPMIIFFTFQLSNNNGYFLQKRAISEEEMNKKIAQAIIHFDNSANYDIKVCLNDGNRCSNFYAFTSSIWFFIEQHYNQRFGNIANIGNGNNYLPFVSNLNSGNVFIVCQYQLQNCLDDLNINEINTEMVFTEGEYSVVNYNSKKIENG